MGDGCEHIPIHFGLNRSTAHGHPDQIFTVHGAWNEIAKIKEGAEGKDSAEVRGWLA